jgi:hypothetical protein
MSTQSDSTRNEAVMRRWIEAVQNNRRADLVDEMLDPHFVSHPLWHEPVAPGDWAGKPRRQEGDHECARAIRTAKWPTLLVRKM